MPTILIADDNPLSLRFFAEAVAASGQQSETAADGETAVALAASQTFDLLLLDARMPRLDGEQALRRIRENDGPNKKTIAIATTAAERSAYPALLAAGFTEVIGKPISLPALRSLLERHLGAASRAADSAADLPLLGDANMGAGFDADPAILGALRGLFAMELDALPQEIAGYASNCDLAALRDRLHRLDASAGFCAAPALAQASQALRQRLDAESAWPQTEVVWLLDCSARTRAALP